MYHLIGLLIFSLLFISLFYKNIEKNNLLLFIVFSFLFILASVRYNIGTDYIYYSVFFQSVKPLTLHPNYTFPSDYMEPLFMHIVALFKYIISNPIFYFSFWSFITLLFFWLGIKKESSNYILSVFILYCIFYHHYLFNTIRQGVVMGIFIYSVRDILDRNFFKILFISIVSSFIHSSGLFILLAYIISFVKVKSRLTIFGLLFLSIFVWKSGLGEQIFTIFAIKFQNVIPNLYMYVKVFFYDHSLTQISQRLLLLIPLIYYYPILSKDDKFSKLFSIYFFGTLIYFSFGFFGLFITRINMFFRILEILLIPMLYQRIKNNNQKIIVQFCIMIWCFTIMTWLYFKEAYYPFKTIFGNFY